MQSSLAFGAAATLGVGLFAAVANSPAANVAKQNIKASSTTASSPTTTITSKPTVLTPQEQEATKVMAGKLDKGAAAPPPPPPVPVAVPKAIDQATAERMKTAEREQFRKAASEARARAEKAAREAAEYRMKLYPDGPEARARRDKEAAETQKVRNISCFFWNRLIYFIDFTSPTIHFDIIPMTGGYKEGRARTHCHGSKASRETGCRGKGEKRSSCSRSSLESRAGGARYRRCQSQNRC